MVAFGTKNEALQSNLLAEISSETTKNPGLKDE